MNQDEVSQLMLKLMGAFPSAPVNKFTSPVYEERLADVDAQYALEAVNQIIDTRIVSSTLPTVGEIRTLALSLDPRTQQLAPGERPAPPPGCNGWRELRPAQGDPEGPYVEGEATDGWWYRFEGKLPVRVRRARAQLEEGEK